MFCSFCGGANPDDGAFCAHCGQPLRPGTQPPSAASPAPGLDVTQALQTPPPVPGQPTAAPQAVGPYTCLVCGYILGPLDAVCMRCKTPRGMKVNPDAPIPGSYVSAGAGAFPNTSGQQGETPAEIRGGWNWGAFYFSWIWGLNHKVYITFLTLPCTLLGFIPYIGFLFSLAALGCRIWFGIKGNEWAWQYRRFDSTDHFRAVQRIWAYWALGIFLGELVLGIVFFAAMVAMFASVGMSSGSGPRPFSP